MRYGLTFKVVLLCVAGLISAEVFADDYVVCESTNDRRTYCDVYRAYESDIRLSKQFSRSSCIEGISWGRDNRGVWVEDGCRAEFSVRRSYGRDSDYNRRDDSRYYDEQARLDYERERQRELDREIERTRELREKLERERASSASAPHQETCPSGFAPGNHRCSDSERRRGCKDMRMPGGTTCNSIGWSK